MDEIQKIVFEIADRCQRRNVPVTDMLAAFVAKAVILENPARFQVWLFPPSLALHWAGSTTLLSKRFRRRSWEMPILG